MTGKLLFVSGLSGAGKTTLGELLKSEDNFAHFNVDVWAFGGDPIAQSGEVPNPAMMEKRDPNIKEAFDNMIENGFKKIASGETVDFQVWENFFSKLVIDIKAARNSLDDKNLVVTFSVYLTSVRDYLRQQLGEDLAFIVLNPSIEHVGIRKVDHLRNTAATRGQSLSQFLRSFNPDSNAPELDEDTIIQLLTDQAKAGAVGFEPATSDEPRTLAIGDLTPNEIREEVLKFLESV